MIYRVFLKKGDRLEYPDHPPFEAAIPGWFYLKVKNCLLNGKPVELLSVQNPKILVEVERTTLSPPPKGRVGKR